MGILLIATPCSVRNTLEQSIGIEKTQTLNKSKSTQQADCEKASEKLSQTESNTAFHSQNQQNHASKSNVIELAFFEDGNLSNYVSFRTFRKSSIPLYILLSRLKYML
jgi:hypothetical protein